MAGVVLGVVLMSIDDCSSIDGFSFMLGVVLTLGYYIDFCLMAASSLMCSLSPRRIGIIAKVLQCYKYTQYSKSISDGEELVTTVRENGGLFA